MKNIYKLMLILTGIVLTGCSSHQNNLEKIDNKNVFTLGTIQKDIKVGMDKSEVLLILGSPNLVSGDSSNETWVYDKISTETSASTVSGSGGILATGAILGAAGVSGSSSSSSTMQRTLTVILKFNENNKLHKVNYHTSRF